MNIEKFIQDFNEMFDFDLADEGIIIKGETKYKELEDWDSLMALSLIALADDTYSTKLTGDEIRELDTIEDLYMFITKKQDA